MTPEKEYLVVSIHDFKTNLSKYIRKLRSGELNSIVVRRYQKPLVALIPLNKKPKIDEKGKS
jgi:antitoxin (DNA-binding transcriptional repressor) of toxin-antitoxin stability system